MTPEEDNILSGWPDPGDGSDIRIFPGYAQRFMPTTPPPPLHPEDAYALDLGRALSNLREYGDVLLYSSFCAERISDVWVCGIRLRGEERVYRQRVSVGGPLAAVRQALEWVENRQP